MESGADNRLSQVGEQTNLTNLKSLAIKALDNLVSVTEEFLDSAPLLLKKLDTSIGTFPQTISGYLDKYRHLPALLGYGTLGLICAYLSLAVLDALNDIPLLGTVFESIGLVYSVWFFVRYLLFASNRKKSKQFLMEFLSLETQTVVKSAYD